MFLPTDMVGDRFGLGTLFHHRLHKIAALTLQILQKMPLLDRIFKVCQVWKGDVAETVALSYADLHALD